MKERDVLIHIHGFLYSMQIRYAYDKNKYSCTIIYTILIDSHNWHPTKDDTLLGWCWFNVGWVAYILGQDWDNTGSMCHVCWNDSRVSNQVILAPTYFTHKRPPPPMANSVRWLEARIYAYCVRIPTGSDACNRFGLNTMLKPVQRRVQCCHLMQCSLIHSVTVRVENTKPFIIIILFKIIFKNSCPPTCPKKQHRRRRSHFTSFTAHSWKYRDRRKPKAGTMPYSYPITSTGPL